MFSVYVTVQKRQNGDINQRLPGAESGERGLSVHSVSKELLRGCGHDDLLKLRVALLYTGCVLFCGNYTSIIKKYCKIFVFC